MDMSSLDKKLVKKAEGSPHPVTQGVWAFYDVSPSKNFDGPDAIVYLAGYPAYPGGDPRLKNDYELANLRGSYGILKGFNDHDNSDDWYDEDW